MYSLWIEAETINKKNNKKYILPTEIWHLILKYQRKAEYNDWIKKIKYCFSEENSILNLNKTIKLRNNKRIFTMTSNDAEKLSNEVFNIVNIPSKSLKEPFVKIKKLYNFVIKWYPWVIMHSDILCDELSERLGFKFNITKNTKYKWGVFLDSIEKKIPQMFNEIYNIKMNISPNNHNLTQDEINEILDYLYDIDYFINHYFPEWWNNNLSPKSIEFQYYVYNKKEWKKNYNNKMVLRNKKILGYNKIPSLNVHPIPSLSKSNFNISLNQKKENIKIRNIKIKEFLG